MALSVSPIVDNVLVDNPYLGANGSKSSGELGIKANLVKETSASAQESKKPNFLDHLKRFDNSKAEKPSLAGMTDRLADIRSMGAKLKQYPMPKQVKEYIKEVKSFLSDVRDHAYGSNKRDELFQKVDVVDQKLADLADKLLAESHDELAIVDSLGELEGLLIDIFV